MGIHRCYFWLLPDVILTFFLGFFKLILCICYRMGSSWFHIQLPFDILTSLFVWRLQHIFHSVCEFSTERSTMWFLNSLISLWRWIYTLLIFFFLYCRLLISWDICLYVIRSLFHLLFTNFSDEIVLNLKSNTAEKSAAFHENHFLRIA